MSFLSFASLLVWPVQEGCGSKPSRAYQTAIVLSCNTIVASNKECFLLAGRGFLKTVMILYYSMNFSRTMLSMVYWKWPTTSVFIRCYDSSKDMEKSDFTCGWAKADKELSISLGTRWWQYLRLQAQSNGECMNGLAKIESRESRKLYNQSEVKASLCFLQSSFPTWQYLCKLRKFHNSSFLHADPCFHINLVLKRSYRKFSNRAAARLDRTWIAKYPAQ